ncbi:hypothetical protein EUGRSUZ_H03922 [Eucalyptus grandis]|uniref:O-methyltransferase domain-containing protein n=2 Tax=Eucalyptus grandis TaxID=71139 RepID=A0A059B4J0_EUCGR|nr:hypothetical protein EUGRSUZ_H03922 [Eucalyptus grandis]
MPTNKVGVRCRLWAPALHLMRPFTLTPFVLFSSLPPIKGEDVWSSSVAKRKRARQKSERKELERERRFTTIDALVSAGGFLSPTEIASRVGAKNPGAPVLVDRMMRLLASHGVIEWRLRRGDGDGDGGEREYGPGPMCRFFAKDQEGGDVGPLFLLIHDKVFMESWYHLNDVIMEGGVPFERAYGMTAFEYPAIDDRFNQVFNRAMASHTSLIMKKILDVYRGFEGIEVLVDVGGGVGFNLKMITSKHPHIRGINFDLPHVLADAPYPGVEHVGGDMFESVPRGDAIFMKWILHDWSDEHCSKLLKNCFEALPTNGKVILVEAILPAVPKRNVSSNNVFQQDLFMLA